MQDSWILNNTFLQLNLSTIATLGTEESGHCKEVAAMERMKKE